jgi:hypothetical protein
MRSFKIALALTVGIAGAPAAFAADPRVGTLACVVEGAYVIDPKTGRSFRWEDSQRSFVAKVSTCADVMSDRFTTATKTFCKNYRADGLVLKTTLDGEEDVWAPAPPSYIANGSPYEGGEFDSTLAYSGRAYVAPRLILRPDLSFDYVRGASTSDEDRLHWWTLQGQCTPFDG